MFLENSFLAFAEQESLTIKWDMNPKPHRKFKYTKALDKEKNPTLFSLIFMLYRVVFDCIHLVEFTL